MKQKNSEQKISAGNCNMQQARVNNGVGPVWMKTRVNWPQSLASSLQLDARSVEYVSHLEMLAQHRPPRKPCICAGKWCDQPADVQFLIRIVAVSVNNVVLSEREVLDTERRTMKRIPSEALVRHE